MRKNAGRSLGLSLAARAAVTAWVCLSISCGAAKKDVGDREVQKTTVKVENRNFLDVRVYLLRGTHRVPLGTVIGSTTREFTVPPDLIAGNSTLRFLADPIGSRRTPVSQEIDVLPGETVVVIIPNFN